MEVNSRLLTTSDVRDMSLVFLLKGHFSIITFCFPCRLLCRENVCDDEKVPPEGLRKVEDDTHTPKDREMLHISLFCFILQYCKGRT